MAPSLLPAPTMLWISGEGWRVGSRGVNEGCAVEMQQRAKQGSPTLSGSRCSCRKLASALTAPAVRPIHLLPQPRNTTAARTVDEQHDLALAVLHLLDHSLQPLLKLAAVPGAVQQWGGLHGA